MSGTTPGVKCMYSSQPYSELDTVITDWGNGSTRPLGNLPNIQLNILQVYYTSPSKPSFGRPRTDPSERTSGSLKSGTARGPHCRLVHARGGGVPERRRWRRKQRRRRQGLVEESRNLIAEVPPSLGEASGSHCLGLMDAGELAAPQWCCWRASR